MELFIDKDTLLKAATKVGMTLDKVDDGYYYWFKYNSDRVDWPICFIVTVFGDHITFVVNDVVLKYMGNVLHDLVKELKLNTYETSTEFYTGYIDVTYWEIDV